MNKKIICKGCQGDMNVSNMLKPYIFGGQLVVQCPMCSYMMRITIDDKGNMKEVYESLDHENMVG